MLSRITSKSSAALFLLAFAAWTIPSAAGSVVPDFSSFTVGTTTPLSYLDSSNGVTLSFSSPNGVFSITPTFFKSINGNALYDVGLQFYTLDIDFSSPITSFATSFALDNSGGTGNLFATALLSGVQVGTASAFATSPGGGFVFPEGVLNVDFAGGFDRLVITSDIGDYALGRDTAGTGGGPGGTTPEPASIALGLSGLAAMVVFKRRRAA